MDEERYEIFRDLEQRQMSEEYLYGSVTEIEADNECHGGDE